jgi:hypothetical protein
VTEPNDSRRPGRGPHGPGQLEAALDAANEQFHESYDGARTQAKHECPVFVLLADTLVVFRDGVRTELQYTPDVFHILKAITHVPVAIYAEIQRGGPNEVSGERRDRLENLQKRLLQTRAKLQEDSVRLALTESALRDAHTTLHACVTMLELALGAMTPEALDQFAKALGPVLLRLTHEATRLQLESLDQCVERALAPMSDAERSELHVVVTGDHQARARSLGMQYFRLRLGESEHTEERVAYAEGVTDEKEAFELVGTRRLDSELARAFFGDEKRLQRDILGDSAETLLRDRPLKPIGR